MTLQIYILQRHVRHILRTAHNIRLLSHLVQKRIQIFFRNAHRHIRIAQIFGAHIVGRIMVISIVAGHVLYVAAKRSNPFLKIRNKHVKLLCLHA